MAAESDRVIVNDLLCFVHNFRACLTPEKLLALIHSHFDVVAVDEAESLLKQYLHETGGPDRPSTAGGEPSERLLAVFAHYEASGAARPVFAAADLRSLPLMLVGGEQSESASLAHVLHEVQELKRLVNELRATSSGPQAARKRNAPSGSRHLALNKAVKITPSNPNASSPESPPTNPLPKTDAKRTRRKTPSTSSNGGLEMAVDKLTNKLMNKIKQDPPPVSSNAKGESQNGTENAKSLEHAELDPAVPLSGTLAASLNPWTSLQLRNGYHAQLAGLAPFSPTGTFDMSDQTNVQWLQAYWTALVAQQRSLQQASGVSSRVSPTQTVKSSADAFSPTDSLGESGGRGAMDLSQGSKSAELSHKDDESSGFGENLDESSSRSLEGLSPTPSDEGKVAGAKLKHDDLLLEDVLDKPYICQHLNCHKRFANKFLLKKHEFIHTGERPHQCPFCGKRFNRKDNLLRHKKTHLANAMHNPKRRHTLVFGVPESPTEPQLLEDNGIESIAAVQDESLNMSRDQVPLTCAQ